LQPSTSVPSNNVREANTINMDQQEKRQGGISDIKVQGEKLLSLEDALGWEKVRAQASAHKIKAVGMLQSFLFQPKETDISIVYEEKRYQAFWHIIGNSFFEYKRKVSYQVPV
jgi:hypothetical protein